MGLDVTAYRGLTKVEALFDAGGEPVEPVTRKHYEDSFRAYVNPDFQAQSEGIEDGAVYTYQERMSGWYGGYIGYGVWREALAKLAGYAAVPHERNPGHASTVVMSHQIGAFEVESGPFHELVCFSDCDGTIGAKVSAKLAKDFAEWSERARTFGDERWYEKYQEWHRCFQMAADGGAVSFH